MFDIHMNCDGSYYFHHRCKDEVTRLFVVNNKRQEGTVAWYSNVPLYTRDFVVVRTGEWLVVMPGKIWEVDGSGDCMNHEYLVVVFESIKQVNNELTKHQQSV